MNAFIVASVALLVCAGAGLVPVVTGGVVDALAGLEFAGTVAAVLLIAMAEGEGRSSLFDLGLVVAFLDLAGGLVYVRSVERRL